MTYADDRTHEPFVRKVFYEDGSLAGWRVDCSCGWGSDWSRLFRKEHLAHDAARDHLADRATTSPSSEEPRRRLRECVENWPECHDGGYDPRCCRFPKSCSCSSYDDDSQADLEPRHR